MGVSYHKQEENKINKLKEEAGLIRPSGNETTLPGAAWGKIAPAPIYQLNKGRDVDCDAISGAAPTAEKVQEVWRTELLQKFPWPKPSTDLNSYYLPQYLGSHTGEQPQLQSQTQQQDSKKKTEVSAPSFSERVEKTVTGSVKNQGAGIFNFLTDIYKAGQGGRDRENREWLEQYTQDLDKSKADLEQMLMENEKAPGTVDERDIKAQKNIVEYYQLLYDTYNKIVNGEVQQQATQAAYDLADKVEQSGQQDVARAKEGLGPAGELMVDIASDALQTVAKTAGGNLGRTVSIVSNYGKGTQRARQDGADEKGQILSGVVSAGADIVTDKFFETTLPFSHLYGGGSIADAMEKAALNAVKDVAETEIGQTVLNFVAGRKPSLIAYSSNDFGDSSCGRSPRSPG